MKTLIFVLLLLQLLRFSYCADETEEVDLSERQYDCQYMWMMNSGPQLLGPSVWLLLCVGLGTAALFSSDVTQDTTMNTNCS